MFNGNASSRVSNSIKIQACPGGIYKSHPKSRITYMKLESDFAENIFSTVQPIVDGEEIVVLQVVAMGEYFLVEYMSKEDYDAENIAFNPNGTQKKEE